MDPVNLRGLEMINRIGKQGEKKLLLEKAVFMFFYRLSYNLNFFLENYLIKYEQFGNFKIIEMKQGKITLRLSGRTAQSKDIYK